MRTGVIYEGLPGVRVTTEALTITGAEHADVVRVARELAAAGAERIELCGGLGAADHAAVKAAVGDDAAVGLNRYAFESLEAIAAYKQAFADGRPTRAMFVYRAEGADPARDRVEHVDATIVAVPDDGAVGPVAAELAGRLGDDGIGLIELYGGLGAAAAARAVAATDGRVPVGFVGYDA